MSAALIPAICTFRPSSSAAAWLRSWGGSSSELRSPESTAAADSAVVGTGMTEVLRALRDIIVAARAEGDEAQ